jgi:hypothetical protein
MVVRMIEVKVFDPPLCCPTGVCGPAPDTRLIDFMEAIVKLQKEYEGSIGVLRGSMGRDFAIFMGDQEVVSLIRKLGIQALPIVKVNGRVAFQGSYPNYEMLEQEVRKEASRIG